MDNYYQQLLTMMNQMAEPTPIPEAQPQPEAAPTAPVAQAPQQAVPMQQAAPPPEMAQLPNSNIAPPTEMSQTGAPDQQYPGYVGPYKGEDQQKREADSDMLRQLLIEKLTPKDMKADKRGILSIEQELSPIHDDRRALDILFKMALQAGMRGA